MLELGSQRTMGGRKEGGREGGRVARVALRCADALPWPGAGEGSLARGETLAQRQRCEGRLWQGPAAPGPGQLSGGAGACAMPGLTPRTQHGQGLHFSASPSMLAIELRGRGAGSRYRRQRLLLPLSHLRAIAVPKPRRLLRCSRGNDAVPLGTGESRGGVDGGQMRFLSKSASVG